MVTTSVISVIHHVGKVMEIKEPGARLARVKAKYPRISDAEARQRTSDSNRTNSKAAQKRSLRNLIPFSKKNAKKAAKRREETRENPPVRDVEKANIIEFATKFLHIDLYPRSASS